MICGKINVGLTTIDLLDFTDKTGRVHKYAIELYYKCRGITDNNVIAV